MTRNGAIGNGLDDASWSNTLDAQRGRRMLIYSPISVHTVGVLAVTLGLTVCFGGNLDVYANQLLCAGAVLRACHLRQSAAK